MPAPELGAVAVKAAVTQAGVPVEAIDEVLMGNVVQAGEGQAPARQAALNAGLPAKTSATTINKVCGSGMKAMMFATTAIRANMGDVFVAGGMENMSAGPYLVPKARFGYRLGHGALLDAVVHDGLWCAFEDQHMGNEAEWVARKYEISREAQDRFALESHRKAVAAIDAGAFDAEIVPVEVRDRKGRLSIVDVDEPPRRDTSMEALARLSPAFEENGTVTAGNAPGITDGAAAMVVMSRDAAERYGIQPLARIVAQAQAAVEPIAIFTAPIYAVRRLLKQIEVDIDYFDLIEVNEAFAAQTLANGRELGWDWDRVNVHGGAIALGHPIGASGARIVVTLLHALRNRGLKTGLATLCLGGGEAVAMAIELED